MGKAIRRALVLVKETVTEEVVPVVLSEVIPIVIPVVSEIDTLKARVVAIEAFPLIKAYLNAR